MINIDIKVVGINDAISSLEEIVQGIGDATSLLGETTAEKMQSVIMKSYKRGSKGTHKLAKSVEKHEWWSIKGQIQYVGVGKISDMPIYWAVVNYGGYTPPANFGYFPSGGPNKGLTGKGKEFWTHTGTIGGGNFRMVPKSPIRPMNYIEKTLNWVYSVWSSYWKSNIPEADIMGTASTILAGGKGMMKVKEF